MKIQIDGAVVTWAGRLKGYASKESLPDRITSLGGTPEKSANANVDILLQGGRAADRLVQAGRAFGCLILDEKESLKLLEAGVIEREVLPQGEPLDALIGELRGWLAQVPSHEAWDAMLGIVDCCHPDQEADLVAFLEPQIARWHDRHVSASHGGEEHVRGQLFYHMEDVNLGELRVMPMRWYAELLAGERRPKYALPRVIMPGMAHLKSNANVLLFKLKETYNLRGVDTEWCENDLSPSLAYYKGLARSKFAESVEFLRLHECDSEMLEAIATSTKLTQLRRLIVESESLEVSDLTGLLSSAVSQTLELLDVSSEEVLGALVKLDPDMLACVKQVYWNSPLYTNHEMAKPWTEAYVAWLIRQQVDTLYVREEVPIARPEGHELYSPLWMCLEQLAVTSHAIRTLDFSACEASVWDERFVARFVEVWAAGLGERITRCVVPARLTDDILVWLASHDVRICRA